MYVVLGWNVFSVGTPRFKPMLVKADLRHIFLISGQRDNAQRACRPSRNQARTGSRNSPPGCPCGSHCGRQLNRASFTAVAPRVLVLLITNCCAREGVIVGKPGTLAKPASALSTVELSKLVVPRPVSGLLIVEIHPLPEFVVVGYVSLAVIRIVVRRTGKRWQRNIWQDMASRRCPGDLRDHPARKHARGRRGGG